MLKVIIFACLVAVALGQAVNVCRQKCDPLASVCPANSICATLTSALLNVSICVCSDGYNTTCTGTNLNGQLTCTKRTDNPPVCNPVCPTTALCVRSSTAENAAGTCVCKDVNQKYNSVSATCMVVCGPNSQTNADNECVCDVGFVATTTANAELRCVLRPNLTATCENGEFKCPTGFTCVDSEKGPYCNATNAVPRCGFEFICPDTVHYVCVDTANGPQCACADGFTGFPSCVRRICSPVMSGANVVQLGCFVGNAQTAYVDNLCFCICEDGIEGDFCNITIGPNDPCNGVDCSKSPNTTCRDGRCVCTDGFVRYPLISVEVESCIPISFSPACQNKTCPSNEVCVDILSRGACICPSDQFGGFLCHRPACTSDADCAELANAYCADNVNSGVTRFCQCSPGFTGERCNITAPVCTSSSCNGTCTNEGRCLPPSALTVCLEITITFKPTAVYTNEQIAVRIANALKIDVGVITVIGPIKLRDGRLRYYVKLCNNGDVDPVAAQSAAVSQGTTLFTDADSVESGEDTMDDSSSSTMANDASTTNAVFAFVTAISIGVAIM